jgi:hypothetical protein
MFLLEIMTLISPANNTDSDTEFILSGRSLGIPCFNVLQAEKIFLVELGYVTSTVCLLFLTQHLNQFSAACRIPQNFN